MNLIIDYGVGNIGSIINAFERINYKFILSKDKSLIQNATRLVLPGVGNFDFAVNELRKSNLISILDQKINKEKIPTLGICLGMHLLANSSAESDNPGLGFLYYEITTLKSSKVLPVPHIGWDHATINLDNAMTKSIKDKDLYYFSHSYALMQAISDQTLLNSNYGETFVAAIRRDNLVGTQFHPEKSGVAGETFLQNFCRL